MPDAEVTTADPVEPAADGPDDRADPAAGMSAAALARYRDRMRRARLRYAAALTVLVVAVGVGVGLAWSNGEISHVSLHTVAAGPPSLPVAAPSRSLRQAWHTGDRAALGDPRWNGTVVTYDAHTVRGRNARTGAQTWAYTRTDRTVCAALQAAGTTLAVYAVDGNCDEITGLDSATGQRTWTRTLDEDGRPVNGHPRYQVFTPSGYSTAVITTPQVIYAIDPSSGLDRWNWYHYGCTIRSVVVGSNGALISQTCTGKQNCSGRLFCGPGTQLILRDATAGYDDTNHPKNPDRIIWNLRGNTDVPVTADSLISALDTTSRTLDTFDDSKGRSQGSIALHPAPASIGPVTSSITNPADVVTIGQDTYAITGRHVEWSAVTAQPPTVVATDGSDPPTLDRARLTVPSDGGVQTLSGRDGRVVHTYPIPAGSASSAWPLGTGFLVPTPKGITAYR